MPIRNPFAKRLNGIEGAPDNNAAPVAEGETIAGFERTSTNGTTGTPILSINSRKSQEPVEYKMSVVNDSGVYLPPSPPEKKGFWPRRSNPSNGSAITDKSTGDLEPFSISRESFDSYRRSFDISARSPILDPQATKHGRQSLDSANLPRLPRSSINERRFERQPPTQEEGFEDVGLNDDTKDKPQVRRGFFSRVSDTSQKETPTPSAASTGLASRFHFTGRKRGQSGQGAELGSIPRPPTSSSQEVPEVR